MLGSSEERRTSRRPARQRARRSSSVPTKERAVRNTARSRVSKTREEKQTAPVLEEEKKVVVETDLKNTEGRKAPTPFSTKKASQKRVRNRNIVLASVLAIGIASSAAVGVTDSGQINVTETMESRNERIRAGANNGSNPETREVEVPVQNTNNTVPNGGLVGSGNPRPRTPQPEPEPVATSTATSSDSVATSTEPVTETDGAIEEEVESEIESDEPDETVTEETSSE